MPILEIISAESPKDIKAFTQRLSQVFAEMIGKPEAYCIVTYQKVDSYSFAGSDKPGFLAKVGSIGHIDNERNAKLTAAVTSELEKELGVSADRGYFIFTDVPAENIGWKKSTFSNILKQ